MTCALGWVDWLTTGSPFKFMLGNVLVMGWTWPMLGTYFIKKDYTISGWADAITPATVLGDLQSNRWRKVRHVCSVWHATRRMEHYHLGYERLRLLGVLLLLLFTLTIGTMTANNELVGSVCDPGIGMTTSRLFVVVAYSWIAVCLIWGFWIRSGVQRTMYEVQRDLSGA